jgi:glucose-1-phosphate adenylyltransferase
MPYVNIGDHAHIYKAIIGRKSVVEMGAMIGNANHKGITLVEENIVIPSDIDVLANSIMGIQKQVG